MFAFVHLALKVIVSTMLRNIQWDPQFKRNPTAVAEFVKTSIMTQKTRNAKQETLS